MPLTTMPTYMDAPTLKRHDTMNNQHTGYQSYNYNTGYENTYVPPHHTIAMIGQGSVHAVTGREDGPLDWQRQRAHLPSQSNYPTTRHDLSISPNHCQLNEDIISRMNNFMFTYNPHGTRRDPRINGRPHPPWAYSYESIKEKRSIEFMYHPDIYKNNPCKHGTGCVVKACGYIHPGERYLPSWRGTGVIIDNVFVPPTPISYHWFKFIMLIFKTSGPCTATYEHDYSRCHNWHANQYDRREALKYIVEKDDWISVSKLEAQRSRLFHPSNYKRRPCDNIIRHGWRCSRGRYCWYYHSEEEKELIRTYYAQLAHEYKVAGPDMLLSVLDSAGIRGGAAPYIPSVLPPTGKLVDSPKKTPPKGYIGAEVGASRGLQGIPGTGRGNIGTVVGSNIMQRVGGAEEDGGRRLHYVMNQARVFGTHREAIGVDDLRNREPMFTDQAKYVESRAVSEECSNDNNSGMEVMLMHSQRGMLRLAQSMNQVPIASSQEGSGSNTVPFTKRYVEESFLSEKTTEIRDGMGNQTKPNSSLSPTQFHPIHASNGRLGYHRGSTDSTMRSQGGLLPEVSLQTDQAVPISLFPLSSGRPIQGRRSNNSTSTVAAIDTNHIYNCIDNLTGEQVGPVTPRPFMRKPLPGVSLYPTNTYLSSGYSNRPAPSTLLFSSTNISPFFPKHDSYGPGPHITSMASGNSQPSNNTNNTLHSNALSGTHAATKGGMYSTVPSHSAPLSPSTTQDYNTCVPREFLSTGIQSQYVSSGYTGSMAVGNKNDNIVQLEAPEMAHHATVIHLEKQLERLLDSSEDGFDFKEGNGSNRTRSCSRGSISSRFNKPIGDKTGHQSSISETNYSDFGMRRTSWGTTDLPMGGLGHQQSLPDLYGSSNHKLDPSFEPDRRPLGNQPGKGWSPEDICEWLQRHKDPLINQLGVHMLRHDIDGELFLQLDDETLLYEMGIKNHDQCLELLLIIKTLKAMKPEDNS